MTPRRPASAIGEPPPERPPEARLRRLGWLAWAALGVAGVVVAVGYVVSLLSLLVVPLVLALFPATLLVPLASWMKRRIPDWAAALAAIGAGILALLVVVGAMVPLVIAELPQVAESVGEGLSEVENLLNRVLPGVEIQGFSDMLALLRQWTGEAGDVAGQALSAALQAFETIAGIALMLVALFFYLKDGPGLFGGIAALAPARFRPRIRGAAERAWDTLGAYFRGQLLVALVDAVLIGLGLLLLGVPLVLPLALLIFFGGLFPIVGAVVTGAVAVLVALADGGLVIGLATAGIVLLVQQIEGNVLEPLILSQVVGLHPLVIILAVTAGGLLLGILGAFIAVPLAATLRRTASYLMENPDGTT